MTMDTEQQKPELTVEERCDRCNAAAKVAVFAKMVGKLVFCKHHFEADGNEQKLSQQGFKVVQDNRSDLTPKPKVYNDDT